MAKKTNTRRGNNEGSIFQRKDGRWVATVTLGYDDNGKRVRKTLYGKTRTDVAVNCLLPKFLRRLFRLLFPYP